MLLSIKTYNKTTAQFSCFMVYWNSGWHMRKRESNEYSIPVLPRGWPEMNICSAITLIASPNPLSVCVCVWSSPLMISNSWRLGLLHPIVFEVLLTLLLSYVEVSKKDHTHYRSDVRYMYKARTRVCMRRQTHLYTEANTCLYMYMVKWVYTRRQTRSHEKANSFALYLASDLYCTKSDCVLNWRPAHLSRDQGVKAQPISEFTMVVQGFH